MGIFRNSAERRLRAPWRLAIATVLVVLATVVARALLAALIAPSVGGDPGSSVGVVAFGVGTTAAVLLAGVALDRRRLADFGFHLDRQWWTDLAAGAALGAGLMTLIFLVELAAGWVRVVGTLRADGPFLPAVASLVGVFLVVGIYEELLVRGYLLRNAAEGLAGPLGERGAVAASVALSSAVFGALHLGNPNATSVSALGITAAGVMLAVGYVTTGELAVPTGLHVTWNAFQGLVYGFPVSGLPVDAGVVAVEQSGPPVATGGAFGPEAGLVGVGAVVVGTAATVAYARWRDGRIAVSDRITTPELRWR